MADWKYSWELLYPPALRDAATHRMDSTDSGNGATSQAAAKDLNVRNLDSWDGAELRATTSWSSSAKALLRLFGWAAFRAKVKDARLDILPTGGRSPLAATWAGCNGARACRSNWKSDSETPDAMILSDSLVRSSTFLIPNLTNGTAKCCTLAVRSKSQRLDSPWGDPDISETEPNALVSPRIMPQLHMNQKKDVSIRITTTTPHQAKQRKHKTTNRRKTKARRWALLKPSKNPRSQHEDPRSHASVFSYLWCLVALSIGRDSWWTDRLLGHPQENARWPAPPRATSRPLVFKHRHLVWSSRHSCCLHHVPVRHLHPL